MINVFEVQETNKMIEESNLDVRTITMGISLLDCCDNDVDVVCDKIYRKITEKAANLVKVGEQIELDYGIPIVNKRISVTPIALVGGSCCKTPEDYVKIAKTLDRAAHTVGINFLGGYSAVLPYRPSVHWHHSFLLLLQSLKTFLFRTFPHGNLI